MAVNPSREEWKIKQGVFDAWTNKHLEKLRGQHHFDELKSPLALGKEANVFTTIGGEEPVVKIYRLENRDFKKMLDYLVSDPRYMDMKRNRRETVFAWTQREYRNLMIAREVIPVPKVIAHLHNILIMEQIGRPEPSPKLKDAKPKNLEDFFGKVIEYMKLLRKKGLVHGDLSAFNILNFDEQPIFIDFSQATPVNSPNAKELWERDVKNIISAAKKFELELKEEDFE